MLTIISCLRLQTRRKPRTEAAIAPPWWSSQFGGLTDGVQPQAVGALAVDGVASSAAVPAAVVAVDVGHVNDAGVSLGEHRHVSIPGLVFPGVVNRPGSIFQVAAHPHGGALDRRGVAHQQEGFTDWNCNTRVWTLAGQLEIRLIRN